MSDLLDLPPEAATEVASEVVDSAEFRDGKALVRYTRTEAALTHLRAKYHGATFDLKTTAGDKAARAARLELTTLRTDLEKRRKAFKEPALEFGRLIDAEAKRITGEIVALEEPIDAQIKADEQRRAAEKAEAARIERERVAKLEAGIATIRSYVQKAAGLPAFRIANGIAGLEAMTFAPEAWQEFAAQATAARDETLTALRLMHAAAVQAEADRAERERLEAEALVLREQAAKMEAERQAERDAEAARIAAERAAEEARERDQREKVALAQAAMPPATQKTITTPDGTVADAGTGEILSTPALYRPLQDVPQVSTVDTSEAPASVHGGQEDEPAVKLGDLCARLGFTMTEAFIVARGITPRRDGRAVLVAESDLPTLADKLVERIREVLG